MFVIKCSPCYATDALWRNGLGDGDCESFKKYCECEIEANDVINKMRELLMEEDSELCQQDLNDWLTCLKTSTRKIGKWGILMCHILKPHSYVLHFHVFAFRNTLVENMGVLCSQSSR